MSQRSEGEVEDNELDQNGNYYYQNGTTLDVYNLQIHIKPAQIN